MLACENCLKIIPPKMTQKSGYVECVEHISCPLCANTLEDADKLYEKVYGT